MKISVIALTGAAVLLFSGCNTQLKPTPENFTATINAYYAEHSDCLFDGSVRFPYETTDVETTRQMDSLVTAQLAEVKKERDLHAARYMLTQAGERAAKNFCFGHRHVVSIDSSTPPAAANGFMETTVQYTYRIEDEPVWAKTPEVVAAFPKLAKETSGTAKDKMVLALTGVGWTVPN